MPIRFVPDFSNADAGSENDIKDPNKYYNEALARTSMWGNGFELAAAAAKDIVRRRMIRAAKDAHNDAFGFEFQPKNEQVEIAGIVFQPGTRATDPANDIDLEN